MMSYRVGLIHRWLKVGELMERWDWMSGLGI